MQRESEPGAPTSLGDYKAFIDALVEIRPDVCARWVLEKRPWPDLSVVKADNSENSIINEFVGKLTDAQREVLAKLMQQSRDGGIHDVLAYLDSEINVKALRLVRDGRELPIAPFGTELYYDWTCRREGDPWPKSDE